MVLGEILLVRVLTKRSHASLSTLPGNVFKLSITYFASMEANREHAGGTYIGAHYRNCAVCLVK